MNNFKIGDLVMLKSGGPVMTVRASDPEGMVACTWFPVIEGSDTFGMRPLYGQPAREDFSFETLQPYAGKP